MYIGDRTTTKVLNKVNVNDIIEDYEKIIDIKDVNNRKVLSHSESPFNVAIRFRPSNIPESSNMEKASVWDLSSTCVYDKLKNTNYFFDHVFDEKSTNQLIFDKLVKDVIGLCLGGINVTIFAYGQTSSGKTHTMLGDNKDSYDGIIPLSINEIFSLANDKENIHKIETEFNFTVSYLEVYNEKLIDLLVPQSTGNSGDQNLKKIKIVDGIDGNIELINLSSRRVTSYNDVLEIIKIGSKIRHVAETSMNERSSRSHTILRIRIDSRYVNSNDLRVGVLNFVDLAGSESIKRTQLEGERRKEGMSINRSLLAVSQVISQLTETSNLNENNSNNIYGQKNINIENTSKNKYISYRDSKITRILSDSLGGNSKTIIVCNCSPDKVNYYETISTLDFAKRAKNIQNKIKVNILRSNERDFEVLKLKNEISTLRKQLSTVSLINCPRQYENNFLTLESGLLNQKAENYTNLDRQINNLDVNCDLCSIYKDRYLEILTKYAEIIDIKDSTIRNLEADINSFRPRLLELEKMKECKNNLSNEIKLKNEQIIEKNNKIDYLNRVLFKTRHKVDILEAQLTVKNNEIFSLKKVENVLNTKNDRLSDTIIDLRYNTKNFINWYIYSSIKKYNLCEKSEEKAQPDICMDETYLNILNYVDKYFCTVSMSNIYSSETDFDFSYTINYQAITRELLELKSDIIKYDFEKQKLDNDIIVSQLNGIASLNSIIIHLFEILSLSKSEKLLSSTETPSEQLGKIPISESYKIKKKLRDIADEIEKTNLELKEKRVFETRCKQLEFELDRLKTDNISLTKQLECNCKENMELTLKINELKYEINSIRSSYLNKSNITSEDYIYRGFQDLNENMKNNNSFSSARKESCENLNSITYKINPSEIGSFADRSEASEESDTHEDRIEEIINKNEVVSSECSSQ
ncbi:kinesin heavy chain [Cryptosporidium xiaoi]|uniref:Kinesin-like protein n=1 Tax=Cryptosporidium xiaoi TaxID=659607 RepID=A0AAV9XTF2_9CRYT